MANTELEKFNQNVQNAVRDLVFGFANSVFISGPPGTGKINTTLNELRRHNIPFVTVNPTYLFSFREVKAEVDRALADGQFIVVEEFEDTTDQRSLIIDYLSAKMADNPPRGLIFLAYKIPTDVVFSRLLAYIDRRVVTTYNPFYPNE